MTLDDLIEALQELKERYPGSGTAEVDGVEETPSYHRGIVYLRDEDDE